MAMMASLARMPVVEDRFTRQSLEDMRGFKGIDGVFRFKPSGVAERSLAIIQINRDGFTVVRDAVPAFALFR